MFRPDGAHLFVRREFTAICLRKDSSNEDSSSALN